MSGALRWHRQAVKLPRQPDCEIADVDHFLHFPFAFSDDFARLEGDKPGQIGFGGAKGIAESPDRLPTNRRRSAAPFQERFLGACDCGVIILRVGFADAGDGFAVDWGEPLTDWTAAAPCAAEDPRIDRLDA